MNKWYSGNDSVSELIEAQEAYGQQNVVRNEMLPIYVNRVSIPETVSNQGVSPDMTYEQIQDRVKENNRRYVIAQYGIMGIKILEKVDDLFYRVELPSGWKLRATSHTMWNDLIDNKDRVRAKFFYKASFYDRDAFINFQTRYSVNVSRCADPESSYEVWEASDVIGTVKDGESIIYTTVAYAAPKNYEELKQLEQNLFDECRNYVVQRYPDYKNIQAYWD